MQTPKPTILQVNPQASYIAHKDAIDSAVARVLDSGWYILGTEVANFETAFSTFCGSQHCIGVASGTDALTLALIASGIGPGDAVATVSFTALATVAAISLTGANIHIVDIEDTGTMCPASLSRVLEEANGAIKAIVPVHLYGHMADMAKISALAKIHNCIVIEDCAQAHGAERDGFKAGQSGNAGCFSFYPTKNLGAIGDGGAIISNDPTLADKLKSLREYGWRDRICVEERGINSRLDEIQAAILNAKLPLLHAETRKRQEIASMYDRALFQSSAVCPLTRHPATTHAFHQYVCLSDQREMARSSLKDAGIATGMHYPLPVHQEPAWAEKLRLPNEGLPSTEALSKQIFSLPMHPHLSDEEISRISTALCQI